MDHDLSDLVEDDMAGCREPEPVLVDLQPLVRLVDHKVLELLAVEALQGSALGLAPCLKIIPMRDKSLVRIPDDEDSPSSELLDVLHSLCEAECPGLSWQNHTMVSLLD